MQLNQHECGFEAMGCNILSKDIILGASAGAKVGPAVACRRVRSSRSCPCLPTAEVPGAVQEHAVPLGLTGVAVPAEDIFTQKGVTYFVMTVSAGNGAQQWQVTKRYNEFHELHRVLCHLSATVPEAPFPRKHLICCDGSNLLQRRKGLEAWLNQALRLPLGSNTQAKTLRRHLRLFLNFDHNMSGASSPQAVLPLTHPTPPPEIGQVMLLTESEAELATLQQAWKATEFHWHSTIGLQPAVAHSD